MDSPDGSPAESDRTAGPPTVSLLSIFTTFLQMGAISFGGGVTGWLYREVVDKRQWMSAEAFFAGLAINQILPGANVTNMTVYVGAHLRGMLGATIALTGLLSAPFVCIIVLFQFYEHFSDNVTVQRALTGAAAAASGLMILLGWKVCRQLGGAKALAIMALTIIAVSALHWSIVAVVAALAPVSILLSWKRGAP